MSATATLDLDEAPAATQKVTLLPLASITATPANNPRKDYGEHQGDYAALLESVKDRGILQPILVRPDLENPELFHVVAGFRRHAAAQDAGMDVIPALVRTCSEGDAYIDTLVENLLRLDLNCIEEAEGFSKALAGPPAIEQETLAQKIRRDQSYISHSLRLLSLPGMVRSLLRSRALSRSHGLELCRLVTGGVEPEAIVVCAMRADENSQSVHALSTQIADILARRRAEEERAEPALPLPSQPSDNPMPGGNGGTAPDAGEAQGNATPHVEPAALPTATPTLEQMEQAREAAATGQTVAGGSDDEAEKRRAEFLKETDGGPTKERAPTPALDAARANAEAAKEPPPAVPAGSGERVATSVSSEDDEWLWEQDLTLDQALQLARRSCLYLTTDSVKLIKALTDHANAEREEVQQPLIPASQRLFALLGTRAQEAGLNVDIILENPE